MSHQTDLFGIESFKQTRHPVKGQRSAVKQLALFSQARQTAQPTRLKRGQEFYIPETRSRVRYIGRIGAMTLWESSGDVYRATLAQVEAVSLKPLH